MAVILEPGYTRCQVRLQNGVNAEGEPVYVSRIFTRIRPNATHENIYGVVQGVLSLQTLPVISMRRLDDGELISE